MKGFDPRWRDLPHYILGITEEIWEGRALHTLHETYAEDLPVRAPAGLTRGRAGVIAATMATLAEFPDRQLLGEDVIWSGDEEEGFLSSHRILSTATHARDGLYGRATGRQLVYRIIADCAVRDNVIYDEWIIRDQGAIVRQLGLDPADYARDRIAAAGGPERAPRPLCASNEPPSAYASRGDASEWGARYADLLGRIMNAELSAIAGAYDRACVLALPGGVAGHGRPAADAFWMGLRAAFPSATFTVEHVVGREDAMMPPRAALRWSLAGRHDGFGAFGRPTGADVFVMGISHAEFGPAGLRREWVLLDETAVWTQILLHTGHAE